MRRSAVDEIGGFDESFFMYVEDLEWGHRAQRHGWETWFTPDALVVHVGNASGEKKYGAARSATWIANSYRFYRRHHGALGTAAYRGANAFGAAWATGRALAARDRPRAAFWRAQIGLHLRRSGDGLPGGR
jgi:GT2 family glycosyltransferase